MVGTKCHANTAKLRILAKQERKYAHKNEKQMPTYKRAGSQGMSQSDVNVDSAVRVESDKALVGQTFALYDCRTCQIKMKLKSYP